MRTISGTAKQAEKRRLSFLFLCGLLVAVLLAGFRLIPDRWTLTQYGSDTGPQKMFYTITDRRGRLVVVDGGWEEDAGDVADVIRSLGGHVAAWIITHPHPDHVGAFNSIMAHLGDSGIRLDHVYTVGVREERYRETAKPYDDYGAFEKFKIHCENLGETVSFLSENDELDLIGLRMKVLSAWDERVDQFENNECNNGSMMFRLDGRKNSMLFCADVQKEMEEYIIPAHKDELKADVVQLGHHGNWGLTQEFYDIVSPSAAFFDAPASVIDVTDASFDGWQLRDALLDRGVTLYRYATAPNRIVLY